MVPPPHIETFSASAKQLLDTGEGDGFGQGEGVAASSFFFLDF